MQYQKEQELLQLRIQVQEATLTEIGKELHDNIGQLLGSTKLLLELVDLKKNNSNELLATIKETVTKALSEVRALSKTLNKEWLDQFDLSENIRSEIKRLEGLQDLKIQFAKTGEINLDKEYCLILFRVIQEAIQNALKHSAAHNIHLFILADSSKIKVIIEDDGRGIIKPDFLAGVGILNMKQRTKLLNGEITWADNVPGCKVVIEIPQMPVS